MEIINGRLIAENILAKCKQIIQDSKIKPTLAIVMIGNNPSSQIYVKKKKEAGEKVGVEVEVLWREKANQKEILAIINELNNDKRINGIIVQLPLPQMDSFEICKAIAIEKDVDGLHPYNFGSLWLNKSNAFIPATVKAIDYALKYVAQAKKLEFSKFIEGKNILIINRSSIIGKPLAGLMLSYNATVTIAHSKTKNLDELIKNYEIIVSGTGLINFIDQQEFKENTILLDVGFNKTDQKIYGDINNKIIDSNIAWLSPVPGGIGPIGVACLIENVVKATKRIS
jgi:methylenetetrahydrofolate dehydrogenase (NADP+)/methenyltetrahydrofolate cyclohydrolase